MAADDCWLSPFYQQDSAAIGVHQYNKNDAAPLFDLCEAIFRNHGGRPHWGKVHSCTRDELTAVYPKFEDFCAVRRKLDPRGKFLNEYLAPFFT